jgi:hypothetical protein
MRARMMKLFISDINYIARRPLLLSALLSPVIFTLFLLYLFPFIAGLTRHEDALSYGRYYSLTAITMISATPYIYGLLFSLVHLKEHYSFSSPGTDYRIAVTKSVLISRMSISAVLSFIMVLPVIFITGAVSTEGWLRSIYAAFLLSMTAPFIFIFSAGLASDRKSWTLLSLISVIFLIALPSGLVLHHPWNYFLFFSPFYWSGWAWVIASPSESIVYGTISLAITAIFCLICFRYIFRKSVRS